MNKIFKKLQDDCNDYCLERRIQIIVDFMGSRFNQPLILLGVILPWVLSFSGVLSLVV